MTVDLDELLPQLGDSAKKAISTTAEVIDVDEFPLLDDMYSEVPKWLRMQDVVAVVADLKGSTKLNFGKYANTSARLYEAVTGTLVRGVNAFDADFVDIQGDGLFALFHGARRYERAMCAGITIKTLSADTLAALVEDHFSDQFPRTGIKVGMDASRLLVKKVGVRGKNEPVWAGRAVNWATKAAQAADEHQLVATRRVFQHFEDNDYVRYSCDCNPGADLWTQAHVEALPVDQQGECRRLLSKWCSECGADFCAAILDGRKERATLSAA
jgi:class 3 adenylate cyclase